MLVKINNQTARQHTIKQKQWMEKFKWWFDILPPRHKKDESGSIVRTLPTKKGMKWQNMEKEGREVK